MNKSLCTCMAVIFGVLHFANAQPHMQPASPRAEAVPSEARDRAEGLMKLDVLVTDAAGNPAIGLSGPNFRLLENGREQKILSFHPFNGTRLGSEPAVKIILLIDTVQLPPNLARDERIAVQSFLRKDGGHLARPVSVFELSDSGLWTLTHPSGDGTSLAREIDHHDFTLVRSSWSRGAGTGVGTNPSEYALKALAHIASDERRRPGRKLLLWVGPGWGIGTGAYAEAKGDSKLFSSVCWFSGLLREAHLVLYSFTVGEMDARGQDYKGHLAGVSAPHQASLVNLYRKVLAIQSGGRVMEGSLDLLQQIESCVQEAGAYYRISFDPFSAAQLDEYHDLKVEVDEAGLKARTTTGYYDQPYYSVNPIPVPKCISIEQLQKLVEQDESDGDKAKQLAGLELTERLSERRLSSLYAIVHGKRTRQELRILADASAFLTAPPDEIPAQAPPNASQQQHMLSMASAYLMSTIHKLPDLLAKRTTARYQEMPMYLDSGGAYQPLHLTDSWTTDIHYRAGSEITDVKPRKVKPGASELITSGEFGPVLQGVLDDIDKSRGLTWSRWEQGTVGRMAVFRYVVPWDKSFYEVALCCLPDGDGNQGYQRYVGYHGEIGIDPESGAILRLVFQADLKSTTPQQRSDLVIEYGPVEIGGKTYICPLRSVSIMRARSVRLLFEWDESFRTYGPYAAMLNDIRFDRYHMFRSESRVLTGSAPSEK